ncbi:hypothetical protein FQA39_LY01310 [Lamprigera yunnana]|nr:hypothetical protein FQA39_LY01310 [Lamprigera yunnana]
MIIQSISKGKQFPLLIKLSTIPIIVGVIMCFAYDIRFNVIGAVFAALGVVVTSLYQVLVNSKQSEMQLDSMQLLYYQAPLSAFLLCLCIPFIEPETVHIFTRHWSWTEVLCVLISCLMAILVNLTTYWILGNTSPLTYPLIAQSDILTLFTVLDV